MNLGIEGKKVLITGASQGIGKQIAIEFAKEECPVTVIARRESELEKVVKELKGISDINHNYYICDLMGEGVPAKVAKDLTVKYEGYDILIHNLGGTLNIKDSLAPMSEWEKVWRYNVGIAIELNYHFTPYMIKNSWGRIIHISSLSGEALRGAAPYCASKAFLNAYTKVLAKFVAKEGIVVSALLPGAIYTAGGHWDENGQNNINNQEAFLRKKSDFLRHHHACGRLGTVEEIAPFAVFMASKYVTFSQGTLINIDGGTE